MPETKLISIRQFGERIHRAPRTVDRLYARGTPGLARIVRINGQRYVTEDEAESFVAEIVRCGALPGQNEPTVAPKSKGGRGKNSKSNAEAS